MNFSSNESKVVIPALLLVLVLVALYFGMNTIKSPSLEITTSTNSTKNIEVSKNMAAASTSVLPEGLPSDIPLEKNHLTESYKALYKDSGVIAYTVSYTSKRSKADLWKMYSDFLTSSGYKIDKEVTNMNLGQISGSKGRDTLMVVVSSHDQVSIVQLNFIVR